MCGNKGFIANFLLNLKVKEVSNPSTFSQVMSLVFFDSHCGTCFWVIFVAQAQQQAGMEELEILSRLYCTMYTRNMAAATLKTDST